LWSSAHGDNAKQFASAVAVTPTRVVAGGYAAGSIDFGGGVLDQHGADDAFVAVFNW
jgi:hypothetical protein